jgi:Protein of unknown function (DUF4245)
MSTFLLSRVSEVGGAAIHVSIPTNLAVCRTGDLVGSVKISDVARTKRQATAGDMMRSLALILIPLVAITIFFTNTPGDHPVKDVDWKPVLAKAREEAPFEVLAPANLPQGWRATRVNWVPQGKPYLNGEASPRNLWQIGFLTPDDVFIDLNQGDVRPEEMVDQQSREGAPDGTSMVADQTWQRLISPDGRTKSLVLVGSNATTVLTADLPYEALEAYASTLSNGA